MSAKAVVAFSTSNQPIPNMLATLRDVVSGMEWMGLTNADGYIEWSVPDTVTAATIAIWGAGYINAFASVTLTPATNQTIRFGASPPNPQDIILPPLVPFRKPFQAAPRYWKGNMCGVRVPGLPAVPGGASDPSLVLSWFFDRYSIADQVNIMTVWVNRKITHVLLSWPDSRAFGQTPQQFRATCQLLRDHGFYVCVMLSSKDYDPSDVQGILNNIAPVLSLLVGLVPMFCVGWELNLFLSPAQVQQLIDALSPQWQKQKGTLGYVHFSPGYFAYQPDGQDTAVFWQTQVGAPPKLTGLLHQRNPAEDNGDQGMYQARISDCLTRFNGADNCPADSGDGSPFDFVALEITADEQFNPPYWGESIGDSWGEAAITTPPAGRVKVQGSGNGFSV